MENALTYLTQGISTGLIYGIVALGFVLIYKSSHVLNFAVGEFLVVGAYVAWAVNSGITSVWPGIAMVWVTLITFIAVIVTALFAYQVVDVLASGQWEVLWDGGIGAGWWIAFLGSILVAIPVKLRL